VRDGRYVLAGTGQSKGLFGLLFDWQGAARTEGIAAPGAQRPLSHRHEGVLNGDKRQTTVDWRGDGAPRARNEPPPDPDVVTPVPAASLRGTADPLTALLTVLDGVNRTGRCEAEAKIWDGRRRYDVSVTHLGEERLVADRPWAYEGLATRCALSFERIGGFWREQPRWRDAEKEGSALSRTIWAAEIAPGRWALVRAEVETSYGTVVGRLLAEGSQESRRGMVSSTQAASTRTPIPLP